jgi:hypothetical protein
MMPQAGAGKRLVSHYVNEPLFHLWKVEHSAGPTNGLWHQTLVVLVVKLLQDRAVHCLLAPAGARNLLLAECGIRAAEITKHGNILGHLFGLLHLEIFSKTPWRANSEE